MTTVTWARHGENLANVTRTLSFRIYDESLTEHGCQQARELAARLAAGPRPQPWEISVNGAVEHCRG